MNPVALYFASGESFYLGAALLVVAVLTLTFSSAKALVWLWRSALWLGLALMVMACPPFPWIVDGGFAAVFLVRIVSLNRSGARWHWVRSGTAYALIVLIVILATSELYRRRLPVIRAKDSGHLVVLGDSISAGLGGNVRPWPEVMQTTSGVQVKNLSTPGATVKDGVGMANHVVADDQLILIELGGNDLLAGEPADEFAQGLESLLKKLSRPDRAIIMFELPLMPQAIRYGQVQRRLAENYRVALIPKRYFAAVISGREATSDGLHLTDMGAGRMASLVMSVLGLQRLSLRALRATPDECVRGYTTTPARHP